MARPRLAIIGEPTEMQVANAHKGIHFLRTRVIGHEAHSSTPERGVNAIAAAAEIIAEIGRLAAECRAAAGADSRFDPPYTSFNIGRIDGGTAVNIIARDCVFEWEFRPVPGEDGAALQRRIEDFVDGRSAAAAARRACAGRGRDRGHGIGAAAGCRPGLAGRGAGPRAHRRQRERRRSPLPPKPACSNRPASRR